MSAEAIGLVVRHGDATGNREHRFIGQTDVPLSDLGRAQATALAARLARLPVTRIVSSDLRRAVDTIRPTAELLGLEIVVDARLREVDNGAWTGLLPAEIAQRWPDLWSRYRAGEDVPRPGGERWVDVRRRVLEAVHEHLTDRPAHDGVTVIATHAGPTLQIVAWAAGVTEEGNIFRGRFGPAAHTSVSTIALPGPRLLGYNDIGHLAVGGRSTLAEAGSIPSADLPIWEPGSGPSEGISPGSSR